MLRQTASSAVPMSALTSTSMGVRSVGDSPNATYNPLNVVAGSSKVRGSGFPKVFKVVIVQKSIKVKRQEESGRKNEKIDRGEGVVGSLLEVEGASEDLRLKHERKRQRVGKAQFVFPF